MTDIELVIKIDEKYWKDIKNTVENDECGENYSPWLEIANGTPLPKGHGRLVDESQIKKCGWDFVNHHAKTDAPTIIGKESEVSE